MTCAIVKYQMQPLTEEALILEMKKYHLAFYAEYFLFCEKYNLFFVCVGKKVSSLVLAVAPCFTWLWLGLENNSNTL